MLVLNKIDLVDNATRKQLESKLSSFSPVFVSARTLIGVDELLRSIAVILRNSLPSSATGDNVLTNRRHYDSAQKAVGALRETYQKLDGGESFELLAFDLRQAINHLEEILGKITTEDLLSEIFSRFCIGK